MIELGVSNLMKQFGETTIFENITFELKTSERLGLIGANGVGKTTIMKILMGMENAGGGDVFKRKGATLGYLNQIPVFEHEIKGIDVVKKAFVELDQIREQMLALEERMSGAGDDLESLVKRHGNLSADFERLGGYMMETNLKKVLTGLSITDELQNRDFHLLSGGEQTRIVLAKILLEKPDVLLLDEPSNHLDMASIEWLEEYLKDYEGAVLIISHDRYFLDRVAMKIVELTYDEAIVYHGNYTYYTIEKERRFLIAMKHYEQQQKKIKKMEEQIKRYRIWGEMRDSDKMYKRAKELEKRLEKMDKLGKPQYEKRKMSLDMAIGERTGKRVLDIENLGKSFDDKDLFDDFHMTLWFKDYFCMLGGNGTGKTTLFRMIMDELKPDSGLIKHGSKVKIGYLPQHIEFDNKDHTVIDYFQSVHPITNSEARKQLAKALFVGDDVFKKVRVLSGGEKSRLKLNVLMYGDVNLLLLDEPTNHLDIESREVLEENLLNFSGTVLFISHDRYFVDKMASRIGDINEGRIGVYEGDYQYYLEEKQKVVSRVPKPVVEAKRVERPIQESITSDVVVKTMSKNAVKFLKQTEADIELLEAEIENLENQLESVGDRLDELNELMERIASKNTRLDELYEKWESMQ